MKKKTIHASVLVDPNEIVTHLVGLKDVRVLSYCRRGPVGELTIEQVVEAPTCPRCHGRARVKERPIIAYTDLPFGGVPMTILWKKHRLRCVNDDCATQSFTLGDHRLAAKGVMLTTRCAKWVVKEIASGQTISHLAREPRCSWDSVNTATRVYGAALLAADTKRLKATTAIGLDETLFVRHGPYKRKSWSTTVCDVVNHQLIDVVPTREFTEVAGWLRAQPHHVKDNLDAAAAEDLLRDIIDLGSKKSSPPEVRRLARTLRNWFDSIVAWHQARVSNGPTEGMNNLIKRVKRVAFGFTNFENFRIRALLYAGKPNLRVFDSMVVR